MLSPLFRKIKTPATIIPIATGALLLFELQCQRFPMNNRLHKKEKPKKQSKKRFVKKATQFIHRTITVVHRNPPKLTDFYLTVLLYNSSH